MNMSRRHISVFNYPWEQYCQSAVFHKKGERK
jgi:hypothetical protein